MCLAGYIAAPKYISTAFDPTEAGLVTHYFTAGLYVLYAPLAALLVFTLASGPTVASPVLANRSVVLLGDASYAFYMLQWPTVILLKRPSPDPLTWWSAAAAVLTLSVVSLACWRWFETPASCCCVAVRWTRRTPSSVR